MRFIRNDVLLCAPKQTPIYLHFPPLSAFVMERQHHVLGRAMQLEPHRIKILE